jgi:hypothetical protein
MTSKKDFLCFISIVLISLLWWLTVFCNFTPRDRYDWDKFFTYHEIQRKTILEYNQFPLWNPYVCGGEPWWAHPTSDFLSPYFLCVLVFGTIEGTIIIYLFQALTGLVGMYFLSRYYKLNFIISILNAVFFLNGFNMLANVGAVTFLNISFLPWIYLFFKRSISERKYFFIVLCLLSYLIYAGNIYIFIISFIVIATDIIFKSIVEKKPVFLLSLFNILFLVFLLTSPKLIPMIELLIKYPRHTQLAPFPGLFNPKYIWAGMLELKRFFYSQNNIYVNSRFLNEEIFGYHFSPIIIFLIILIPFLLWKKYKQILILNIIFLFLALGDNSPVNLWRLVHFFIGSLKANHKFFGGYLTVFSLTIGIAIKEAQEKYFRSEKLKVIIPAGLLFMIFFNVFLSANKIFKDGVSTINYNLKDTKTEFFQTIGDHRKMFDSVHNNQGVVYGYDSIGNQIKIKVIPREYKEYKGEYFLTDEMGKIDKVYFSPNLLRFSVNLSDEDTLVINQNYFPGWRSSTGKVINHNGLIGIPLKKIDKKIVLFYLPSTLVIGLIIFSLNFLVIAILVKTKFSKNKIRMQIDSNGI